MTQVSKDNMMRAVSPKTNDFLQNTDHEVSFCSRSVSNGGKRDGFDKGICVIVLADRPGDAEIPVNHAAEPYPRNLTLIK